MPYFIKFLKNNEELIKLVRRHPLSFLKPGLMAILLLLLPFFLMFLLFKWGTAGLIIFITLTLIGIFCLGRIILLWHYNSFILTNSRAILIKQKGLFDRQVSEINYQKIEDVAYRIKGIKQTIFRYGSIKIQNNNSDLAMIVNNIPKPQELQQQLLNLKKSLS